MASNRGRVLRCAFVLILSSAAAVSSKGVGQPTTSVPRVLVQVQRVSWGHHEDIRGGLLTREMVRQAVFIACRDELGLSTADAVLDESPRADRAARLATLSVLVETPSANRLRVDLRRSDTKSPQKILTKEYKYNEDARYIYQSLAHVLTPEIRSTLAPALRASMSAEASRPASERRNDETQMNRIEELMHEMNFSSQLVAVRLAHAQGRQRHDSAIYGALARGYAHLALLT